MTFWKYGNGTMREEGERASEKLNPIYILPTFNERWALAIFQIVYNCIYRTTSNKSDLRRRNGKRTNGKWKSETSGNILLSMPEWNETVRKCWWEKACVCIWYASIRKRFKESVERHRSILFYNLLSLRFRTHLLYKNNIVPMNTDTQKQKHTDTLTRSLAHTLTLVAQELYGRNCSIVSHSMRSMRLLFVTNLPLLNHHPEHYFSIIICLWKGNSIFLLGLSLALNSFL